MVLNHKSHANRERGVRFTSSSDTASAGPSSPESSFATHSPVTADMMTEVLDELQEVRESVRQLTRTSARHEQLLQQRSPHCPHDHCAHLKSVYSDLHRMLSAGSTVPAKDGALGVLRSLASRQSAVAGTSLSSSAVEEVLTNFHDTLSSFMTQTEQQLATLHTSVKQLSECTAQCVHELGQIKQTVSQLQEESTATQHSLSEWKQNSETSIESLRTTLHANSADSLHRIQNEVLRHRDGAQSGVEGRLKELEKQMKQIIDDAAAHAEEHQQRLEQRIERDSLAQQKATKELQQRIESLHTAFANLEVSSHTTADAIDLAQQSHARSAALQDARAEAMKNEMEALRSVVQTHGEWLGEIRSQGSLEGAFAELKDWVKDLGETAASKGELLQAVHHIEEELREVNARLLLVKKPEKTVPLESTVTEKARPTRATLAR